MLQGPNASWHQGSDVSQRGIASCRVVWYRCHTAKNIAAITGPRTKPLIDPECHHAAERCDHHHVVGHEGGLAHEHGPQQVVHQADHEQPQAPNAMPCQIAPVTRNQLQPGATRALCQWPAAGPSRGRTRRPPPAAAMPGAPCAGARFSQGCSSGSSKAGGLGCRHRIGVAWHCAGSTALRAADAH